MDGLGFLLFVFFGALALAIVVKWYERKKKKRQEPDSALDNAIEEALFSDSGDDLKKRLLARVTNDVLLSDINLALRLDYKDMMDDDSTRSVTVHIISGKKETPVYPVKPTHLHAYCHQKNDLRTFHIDNIERLTDMDTGETYSNDNIAEYFKNLVSEAA